MTGSRGARLSAPDDAADQELADLLGAEPQPTRRPTAPALETELFRKFPVLDHGFVRIVDYMGDDAAIVQAARVSYGRGTRTARTDRGLIRYLMRHRHSTPFEMCEVKLHIKLPIFVARQWIRHRTANVNEISARYSILDREFYVPAPDKLAAQSSSNRQGRGAVLEPESAQRVIDVLRRDATQTFLTYETLLNDQGDGEPRDPEAPQVARELARMNLTLATYTQWYWKIDLHNLLHFLSLRLDEHAQWEIRAYAQVMADLVRAWVPLAWEAFSDYRLGAHTFSREELELVRALIRGSDPDDVLRSSSLSLRERKELRRVLELGPPKRPLEG